MIIRLRRPLLLHFAIFVHVSGILNVTTASTITVERSFYDSNDRITPGNFKHWEYKCNEQGNKCSCYYQGTFYSEEGERASCHNKDKIKNCQNVETYHDGISINIGNQQTSILKVLFWSLNGDQQETGAMNDFTDQSKRYLRVSNNKLVISGLPATWKGQLFKVLFDTGNCVPLKVQGSITYPFDFKTIFTKDVAKTTQASIQTTPTQKQTSTLLKSTPTKSTPTSTKSTPTSTESTESTSKPTTRNTNMPTNQTPKSTTTQRKNASSTAKNPGNGNPGEREDDGEPEISTNLVIAFVIAVLVIIVLAGVLIFVCRRNRLPGKDSGLSVTYNKDGDYVSPTDTKENTQSPGFYTDCQDLNSPLYKSTKITGNRPASNIYDTAYDNPELYQSVDEYENDFKNIGNKNQNNLNPKLIASSLPVTEQKYRNFSSDSTASSNDTQTSDASDYAALSQVPENIYATGTVERRKSNDYTLLEGDVAMNGGLQATYATLESNPDTTYATLEETDGSFEKTRENNYQALQKNENRNSFSSKYVGW